MRIAMYLTSWWGSSGPSAKPPETMQKATNRTNGNVCIVVRQLVYLRDPRVPQTMRHSRNELQSTQKARDIVGRQNVRLKYKSHQQPANFML